MPEMTAKEIGDVVHQHIHESLARAADEMEKFKALQQFSEKLSDEFIKLFDGAISSETTLRQIDAERIMVTHRFRMGTEFGSLLRDVKASIWSRRCIRTRRRLRGALCR